MRGIREMAFPEWDSLAEGEGFEPPTAFTVPGLQPGALVHSAILPSGSLWSVFIKPRMPSCQFLLVLDALGTDHGDHRPSPIHSEPCRGNDVLGYIYFLFTFTAFHIAHLMVGEKGLEPPRPKTSGPKPDAAAVTPLARSSYDCPCGP